MPRACGFSEQASGSCSCKDASGSLREASRVYLPKPLTLRLARGGGAEQGGVRPFGVSLLMAGHDTHGPQLYQIDPSGSYFAWKASAIGKNMTNAKTFLEKRYSEVRPALTPKSPK